MTAARVFDDILIRANRGMGQTTVGGAKPRGERVWKSLTSTGSAFVKRIPGAGVQHPKQLAGQLAYVNGKAKGVFASATCVHADGDAFEQADLEKMMETWAAVWTGRPRNGHTSHLVLSFPDDVSASAASMIAQEWCAEMFEGQVHVADSWEYVAALHTDTENPHVHVILNNRGQGGTWFSIASEGVFTPQMMRDRMTDIADDYGVRLESLTRADRGLYRDPITSADVFAAREGRILSADAVRKSVTADWRREDMLRTAQLYWTLADFADTIGASMIANRAYISAAALVAGDDVPKGQMMDIELDVTADREDIRTSLIGWAEQNSERIAGLPEAERTDIMGKIDAALTLIEGDVTPDLRDETIWLAFKATPSSYLIPDIGALEARAALYIDADKADLLREFVSENLLDRYLVTGEVASKYAAILPVMAEAYQEMHTHRLEEIPKEMKAYVQKAARLGIDPLQMQERLINVIDDPAETMKIEREDVAKIVAARGGRGFDINRTDGALGDTQAPHGEVSVADGALSQKIKEEQSAFLSQHPEIIASPSLAYSQLNAFTVAVADRAAFERIGRETDKIMEAARSGASVSAAVAARFKDRYPDMPDHLAEGLGHTYQTVEDARNTVRDRSAIGTGQAYVDAYRKAEADYRDLQLALGDVEDLIIADSKMYNRDGVARVLQDMANTAAASGRADLADSTVGRHVLTAFVALEGRGVMQEIAAGNMDALAEYIDTPAHQRLAAKELLKSATSLDVGLEPSQIEAGLEAVDPNYSRGGGLSI